MKKVLSLLAVLCAAITINAADDANLSLEAGYNNYYTVNGVAYAKDTPFAGIGAVKSLKYADVYAGGTLLANGKEDQSHWLIGAGKNLITWKEFTPRLDASVARHQTASVGIPNSTEFGVKLAVQNPYVTPYVRGSFNIDLEQNGYAIGVERAQKLPFGFVITPSAEWATFTSYESINAKASLTRPVTFAWGTVSPFAEVGWYNNGTYNAAPIKYSLGRFNDTVVYAAGIKLTF